MAASDSDLERTESPSAHRLQKAREEGQVARSRELSTLFLIGGATLVFFVQGATVVDGLAATMRRGLSLTHRDAMDPHVMLTRLAFLCQHALWSLSPLFAVLIVLSLLASVALGGWTFAPDALMPNFGRLSPQSGLKRIVSINGLSELGKAILKTIVLGAVGTWLLWAMRDAVLALGRQDVSAALGTLGGLVGHTLLVLCGGLALLAALDVPLQLYQHHHRLKMTRQEVIDENKQQEGDPRVKARIRQAQRAMARRRMMAAVPKADVVVVNPTHYAVALVYNERMRAPKVVAKGTDLIAARIRELATEHRVPILDAPPLARALYRHTDLEQEIPGALYEAVALVMAYVFQLRRHRTEGGAYPLVPTSLPVPAGLDPLEEKRA